MKIKLTGADPALLKGVGELSDQLGITLCEEGIPVRVGRTGEGLSVSPDGDGYIICYNRTVEFYRALGLLAEGLKRNEKVSVRQSPRFRTNGFMADNSRNAVQTVPTIKRMLRYMALMGLPTLQMYTEDTFEIREYPYFGYMRGRFTPEEIRECDAYAAMFGIELIPCIQTLGHLNQALRWKAFQEITDCEGILLAGEEKTYEFLDKMLASVSSMFRSRRINIGMDEAYMVGLGKYLDRNGYRDRFEIMKEHLSRVLELCKKYGFQAMMWSDMFFHLLTSVSYYSGEEIPSEILDSIPPEVSIVYWDYYSEKKEIYDRMLDSHLKFHNPVVFAGGAWKWTGFAPAVAFGLRVGGLALQSCLEKGVRDIFVTSWGDCGAECSIYSVLPVLQLYAETDYNGEISEDYLAKRFAFCTGGSLEDFMALDMPNLLPDNPAPGKCSVNPSKYLLFQDIMCGLFDRHVEEGLYNSHYLSAATRLAECADRNPGFGDMFMTLSKLSEVLAIKCDIGVRLRNAYMNGDRSQLETIYDKDIAALQELVQEFHLVFRRQWMGENKVFGFDVQDLRLGGLLARLAAARGRIREYLDGKLDRLEELEQERLFFDARSEKEEMPHIAVNRWHLIATAGVL